MKMAQVEGESINPSLRKILIEHNGICAQIHSKGFTLVKCNRTMNSV